MRWREFRRLRGPEAPVQPGWEISFGQTGNRNRFLTELLRVVPEGTVLDVQDDVDEIHAKQLEPFLRYWRSARWFRPAVMGVAISSECRAKLEAVIEPLDLTKAWGAIKIFKDDEVFFASNDYMYDSAPFVAAILGETFVQNMKQAGVIASYDWFEPEN